MFSPIGAPKEEESEVNWLDDLKFFIDNDSDILSRHFFPAVKKHQKYVGNPNAFKIYVGPLESCKDLYCEKYDIESPEEKFSKEKIIELAKVCAEEQEKIIKRGDYK